MVHKPQRISSGVVTLFYAAWNCDSSFMQCTEMLYLCLGVFSSAMCIFWLWKGFSFCFLALLTVEKNQAFALSWLKECSVPYQPTYSSGPNVSLLSFCHEILKHCCDLEALIAALSCVIFPCWLLLERIQWWCTRA